MGEDKRAARMALVQVTVWGQATDKDLMSWFPWYKKRGTPAAVVRREATGRMTAGVSIWRYGETDQEAHGHLPEVYVVEAECHGFSRLAGRGGGKVDV